jgi:hypothetical protein
VIRGVEVTVKTPSRKYTTDTPPVPVSDRFGNAVYEYASQTVANVLVSPGATNDLEASRPEGVTVAYTLHFPKTFNGSLEGCIVTLPAPWAGDYRVIGDPRSYIDANCPTPWHTPVEVERAHG